MKLKIIRKSWNKDWNRNGCMECTKCIINKEEIEGKGGKMSGAVIKERKVSRAKIEGSPLRKNIKMSSYPETRIRNV